MERRRQASAPQRRARARELAHQLGIDSAWAVERHLLQEYSHCTAPEVFLVAAAGRTKRIRLGHGIRQVIARYSHPTRTAECLGMLDLVSNGQSTSVSAKGRRA